MNALAPVPAVLVGAAMPATTAAATTYPSTGYTTTWCQILVGDHAWARVYMPVFSSAFHCQIPKASQHAMRSTGIGPAVKRWTDAWGEGPLSPTPVAAAGYRVALAGGGDALRNLALAARDLKEGRRTHHPELILFPCWRDLQDYAAHDPAGRDLQPLVNLVDHHGTDAILAAVAQLRPEQQAQVTVSTAHRAKGREWPRVLIADDFVRNQDDDCREQAETAQPSACIDDAEARLAYVAVTRTRHRLDPGGLSWIHGHRDSAPPA